jgi:hypothetical protein
MRLSATWPKTIARIVPIPPSQTKLKLSEAIA